MILLSGCRRISDACCLVDFLCVARCKFADLQSLRVVVLRADKQDKAKCLVLRFIAIPRLTTGLGRRNRRLLAQIKGTLQLCGDCIVMQS